MGSNSPSVWRVSGRGGVLKREKGGDESRKGKINCLPWRGGSKDQEWEGRGFKRGEVIARVEREGQNERQGLRALNKSGLRKEGDFLAVSAGLPRTRG